MDPRKAPRHLLVLCLGLAIALVAPSAYAQNKVEAAAKALQKKAMEEDYLATDFAKAAEKLDKAIAQCGTDKCSAQVRAHLRRDLGVVQIGGQIDRAKGVQNFVEALKIDPSTTLDPDLKTKELEAAFAEAKKKAAAGGGTAAGAGAAAGGAAAAGGEQPQGDFVHTPAAEQQIRTPIPVYVEYAGEEQVVKVIARYKGFGMTEWKTVELKPMAKGWGGQLPCADVQQGTTQYYLQGFNANNDPVVTGGDRNHPYKVSVKREAVAEPPHLPGQEPAKQCADTGDCPPNFPGCKKAGGAGVVSKEEVIGKDGGEYCEEDNECRSGKCEDNKCTDPEGPKKHKRFWVGVFGAFDYSFVSSANDVCKLTSPKENQVPLNDSNYYCTLDDGSDYPYRRLSSQDTNPRGPENDRIVMGQSDKVDGGGAFGNVRLMASLDYAVNLNVLVGARLGYVLNAYPGQAAKDDGKTFPPVHVEARGTYLFGQDALLKKVAPYGFVGAGVSTWDARVKVTAVEQDPTTSKRTGKEVDAWQIGGPGFLAFGGGVRLAFSQAAALMGGLRVNLAFGNAFLPSVGPELGIVFGF